MKICVYYYAYNLVKIACHKTHGPATAPFNYCWLCQIKFDTETQFPSGPSRAFKLNCWISRARSIYSTCQNETRYYRTYAESVLCGCLNGETGFQHTTAWIRAVEPVGCHDGKQCGTDHKKHSYCHKRLNLVPERRDILQPPVRSFEKPPYLRRSALQRRPSPCSGWRPLSGPLCCVAPRVLCRIRVRERAPAAAPPRTPPHPHKRSLWQRKQRHDGKGSGTNKPARVQTCCVWELMWPEMWTKHWLDKWIVECIKKWLINEETNQSMNKLATIYS